MFTLIAVAVAAQWDEDEFRQRMQVIRRWLQLCGLSMEKAALVLGIDKAVLHRQVCDGEGHVSLTRILMLASSEQIGWLGVALAETYGVPATVQAGARLERAANRKRMASATLAGPAEREMAS